MAKKTLNPVMLETVTSEGKPQLFIFDTITPGLAIRVTSSGKKTWYFMYTSPADGKRAQITLGTFPAIKLKDARLRAEEQRGVVQGGKDPRLVAELPGDKTIAELIDDRIRLEVRPDAESYLRSCMDIERSYDADVIPVVGRVAVKDFRVTHWNKILDPIIERGAPVAANRVFANVRALLKFGVQRGEIEFNVLREISQPFDDEEARDRYLTLDEIRHFWAHSPKAMIRSRKMQLILKLCLTTGKRVNEVCGARRAEINHLERVWTIPKSRVKGRNKKVKDELVPLSDLALALFDEALRMSNSEFVFPDKDDVAAIVPSTVSKTLREAVEPTGDLPLGRLGIAKFTPHDLRRTVGTQMLNKKNGLGITKAQKYLALNHKTPDADDKEERNKLSDRVYDHNDYQDDKREALVKWGDFLARLVGEDVEQREAA